jgi:hypothetical protein
MTGDKFQPSPELKAARRLLDVARSSGHERPIISYEGLEAYFTVLEQEERQVFALQQQVGANAWAVAMARNLFDAAKRAHGNSYVRCAPTEKWAALGEALYGPDHEKVKEMKSET